MKPTTRQFILYKATSPSNKIYIGITAESLQSRKSKHLYGSKNKLKNSKFSRAINKYGIDGLHWEIIAENLSQEEAKILEIQYIEKYETFKKGYNSTRGGEGAWGYKWKREAIDKLTEKLTKQYYTDTEWCEKQSKIIKQWYKDNPELAEKYKLQRIERLHKTRHLWEARRIKSVISREAKIKSSKTRGCKEFNVYHIQSRTYVGTWFLKSECMRELNLNNGKISSCLKGDRKQHHGYIFKYTDDPTVNGTEFNDIWLTELKRKPNKGVKNGIN